MWIFWTCIFFPQDHNDVQCSMNYGPAHGSQSNVYILEENFFNVLLCAQLYKCMKVAKLAMLQIMWYVEDKKTFSTLIFMKMNAKLTMWAFGFVVAYVCITIIYCWHFSLWWRHNSLNKWNNKKLLAWCVLASIAHYNKQHLVFVMLISLSFGSR